MLAAYRRYRSHIRLPVSPIRVKSTIITCMMPKHRFTRRVVVMCELLKVLIAWTLPQRFIHVLGTRNRSMISVAYVHVTTIQPENLAVWWFAFTTAKFSYSHIYIWRSRTKPPKLGPPILLH